MRRLLLYAGIALAIFSFTYCTGNSSSENAGDTATIHTDGTNSTLSTDKSVGIGTGTYDTGLRTSMDTTDIKLGTDTNTGNNTGGSGHYITSINKTNCEGLLRS